MKTEFGFSCECEGVGCGGCVCRCDYGWFRYIECMRSDRDFIGY